MDKLQADAEMKAAGFKQVGQGTEAALLNLIRDGQDGITFLAELETLHPGILKALGATSFVLTAVDEELAKQPDLRNFSISPYFLSRCEPHCNVLAKANERTGFIVSSLKHTMQHHLSVKEPSDRGKLRLEAAAATTLAASSPGSASVQSSVSPSISLASSSCGDGGKSSPILTTVTNLNTKLHKHLQVYIFLFFVFILCI